jgi:5-methylcytosine-specific restriction endonuclease McrA
MNSRNNENCNQIPTSCPQGTPTRKEWLERVLFAGVVSKVAQHLALAIHFKSGSSGVLSASMRDLERITGWRRATIAAHLRELEAVADISYRGGRAKSLFQLQYDINARDIVEVADQVEFVEVVTVESKAALRLATIGAFGHACSHCDRLGDEARGPDERPWCLDRIIPGAVGGKYQPDNVTLSCWACNSKRGASPIERRTFSLADWRMLHAEWLDVGTPVEEACNV